MWEFRLSLVFAFVAGLTLGGFASRIHPKAEPVAQNDTVMTFRSVRYSKLQLKMNTYSLDLGQYQNLVPEYVFIEKEAVRDTAMNGIPYVMLQRQYLMTEMNGVKIMHSGIGSRIDSVELYHPIRTVMPSVVRREKKHSLALGLGVAISTRPNVPITLEYDYMARPWLCVGGRVGYDIIDKRPSLEICAKTVFEW